MLMPVPPLKSEDRVYSPTKADMKREKPETLLELSKPEESEDPTEYDLIEEFGMQNFTLNVDDGTQTRDELDSEHGQNTTFDIEP